jgi:hypothetical protein
MNKQTFVYKFDSYQARLGNWCLLRISIFCQLYCDYPTYWARSNDNHTMHLPHCISRWNRAVHPSEGFEPKPLVQCNTDSLRIMTNYLHTYNSNCDTKLALNTEGYNFYHNIENTIDESYSRNAPCTLH